MVYLQHTNQRQKQLKIQTEAKIYVLNFYLFSFQSYPSFLLFVCKCLFFLLLILSFSCSSTSSISPGYGFYGLCKTANFLLCIFEQKCYVSIIRALAIEARFQKKAFLMLTTFFCKQQKFHDFTNKNKNSLNTH